MHGEGIGEVRGLDRGIGRQSALRERVRDREAWHRYREYIGETSLPHGDDRVDRWGRQNEQIGQWSTRVREHVAERDEAAH